MKSMLFSGVFWMALVGLVGLMVEQAAAIPALQFIDGSTVLTVADGSPQDSNPQAGAVTFIGPITGSGGNWGTNVTTGISIPILGTASQPQLDLSSVNVLSPGQGTGTLTIRFSDTDFTANFGLTAAIGGTTGGTVSSQTYVDNRYFDFGGNTLFGTTTPLTALGPFGGPAFSGHQGGPSAFIAPFSLTQEVTLDQGPGASSFNASLAVPEPTSLLLLGLGLLGLGIWSRKTIQA